MFRQNPVRPPTLLCGTDVRSAKQLVGIVFKCSIVGRSIRLLHIRASPGTNDAFQDRMNHITKFDRDAADVPGDPPLSLLVYQRRAEVSSTFLIEDRSHGGLRHPKELWIAASDALIYGI